MTFDPAQPYAVLNGTAYSRVLGWYDQGTTGANGDDFYATYAAQLNGTNYVWIEKTGGSPELKTYFINEDVTGDPGTPYTPIFGTDGSFTKWRWDGFMDHNAYAVDLKNIRAPTSFSPPHIIFTSATPTAIQRQALATPPQPGAGRGRPCRRAARRASRDQFADHRLLAAHRIQSHARRR